MDQLKFAGILRERLNFIYGETKVSGEFLSALLNSIENLKTNTGRNLDKWSEKDIILITYGDSIKRANESPLKTLRNFLIKYLKDSISCVHILPFFPYSSDDGFSVIDYRKVHPDLGNWNDIEMISGDYSLMTDLVINHISKESKWFRNFLEGKSPGDNFFIEVDPDSDLSKVVRPRSLPLLTAFDTRKGRKYVWTTFSNDQIDMNFANQEVLFEMLKVLLFYFKRGAKIIRLDAIAFLWKEIGTSCLHLPQTHEVVKLIRDIGEYIDPGIIIITETNVPNRENISYFGKGDEAHMVYQFSLPSLLLHAFFTADSRYLNTWANSISDIPDGCTFFNFTASHDGIGVRPLEGILPQNEIAELIRAMKSFGGDVSTKRNSDGSDSPYEMNITYFDALRYTSLGKDHYQVERFICSQTIMMSFKGIPAFYIHSLLGTHNFTEGVRITGMKRTINRRKWNADELYRLLSDENEHSEILKELKRRIDIRKQIPAFHPDCKQKILHMNKNTFALLRGDEGDLLILANISPSSILIDSENLSFAKGKDLITNKTVGQDRIALNPYQVMWIEKKEAVKN